MALDPKTQVQKNRPLILNAQTVPADNDLAPGDFALFPETDGDGNLQLAIKSRAADGTLQTTGTLTQGAGQSSGDANGTFTQYIYTVMNADISANGFSLSPAPKSPETVCLRIIGGVDQINGTDFEVTGSTLSWSGLGLMGEFSQGDQVYLSYFS